MDSNIVNLNQPSHCSPDGSTSAVDLCIVSDNLHSKIDGWHTNEELNAKYVQMFDH